MLDLVGLPKNINGFRTTHTCELCGFEPKTKNKYREKQDHLVMKHFKEKIDKIFPHSRPYCCPTNDCGFTGKDKQALLRHYTGKHGILEKYLREALAEKGINYATDGSKRKNNSCNGGNNSGNNGTNGDFNAKNKQARLSTHDTQQQLNIQQQQQQHQQQQPNGGGSHPVIIQSRPNTEELRKEVEAMMASFQPVDTQVVFTLPPISAVSLSSSSSSSSSTSSSSISTTSSSSSSSSSSSLLSSSSVAQVVTALPVVDVVSTVTATTTTNNNNNIEEVVTTTNQQQQQQPTLASINLPQLLASSTPIKPPKHQQQQHVQGTPVIVHLQQDGQIVAHHSQPQQQQQQQQQQKVIPLPSIRTIVSQLPLEIINGTITTTSSPSSSSSGAASSSPPPPSSSSPSSNSVDAVAASVVSSITTPVSLTTTAPPTTISSIIENAEVMWGSGASAGPAVIVEAANAVPVTYIETVDGTTYTTAHIDNIDDYLYATTVNASEVRERQLDFCML